jgi:DNA-binding transcriptional ArsR family regulator
MISQQWANVRSLDHCHPDEITLSGVLYALADPIRLEIARILSDGHEHIQADFPADVTQSTLSHHMKRLREAGVAWSRPEGTRCFVSLRLELEDRLPGLLAMVLTTAEHEHQRPSQVPGR